MVSLLTWPALVVAKTAILSRVSPISLTCEGPRRARARWVSVLPHVHQADSTKHKSSSRHVRMDAVVSARPAANSRVRTTGKLCLYSIDFVSMSPSPFITHPKFHIYLVQVTYVRFIWSLCVQTFSRNTFVWQIHTQWKYLKEGAETKKKVKNQEDATQRLTFLQCATSSEPQYPNPSPPPKTPHNGFHLSGISPSSPPISTPLCRSHRWQSYGGRYKVCHWMYSSTPCGVVSNSCASTYQAHSLIQLIKPIPL